ncbi:unnamed protein product [Adineta steineri]|uniref:ADP ribosyltransferase domain-containing protein n=1 Tax=Adineta steineri TaxID=433720 RepID=A0A815SDR2_9BILA|nr:unnamed protein product [Adineta steineri]
MTGSKSNQNAAVPSNIRQPRQRMTQNCLLLWADTNIEQTEKHHENTLEQIRNIAGDVNVFTEVDACIDFLTDAQEDIKSFLVVKDIVFQQIMPLINDIPQLGGVYIFNDIETPHEEWNKNWQKIKSVHTNIDSICKRLQLDIKKYHQDSIAMSFISATEMASTDNLNELEPTFMYTQLFKEILLDMKHDEKAIKQFTAHCRHHDCGSAKNIDYFEKNYDSQSPVWWYTYPSFIYSMLNYALRSMEGDTIINMGFFIQDLHQQIQQLHQQQAHIYHGKPFIVYRGQALSKASFEKLKKTGAGLMSFNNFLSTSTDQDIARGIADSASENVDMVGILFIMSIDPSIKSTPFASIHEESYFKQEAEILFSMHAVFRVGAIQQIDNNNQLYQVELQLTSDDDQQLRVLTDRIRKEVGGAGWPSLSSLLLKTGQFDKAGKLCNVLLEQTSNEVEKAVYYTHLGAVHCNQGDYGKAVWYFEQDLKICEKTLPSNDPSLATSYNNIASVYETMGEYSKALSLHKQGLEIRQNTLPSDHPDLAISYSNIGNVYYNMGKYSKALSFYETALEIRRKALPSNHPHLATSYNNIAAAYDNMGKYSKALSFYEKALEIKQKVLPSGHPDLAVSYNNIAAVYDNMGKYPKALSFYEKALQIAQKALPSNLPLLASSYNNIAAVYDNMGKYPKALSFYERALEIKQKILSPNHPDLSISYGSISMVYGLMEEYSKAVSFYEKAFAICQKTLPSNHPYFATLFNNIGSVYEYMGESSKAVSFYEKTLEILKKTLSSNHPHLATLYNNIGMVYSTMGEYSTALSYHEKDLAICQNILSSNHPHLGTTYSCIGGIYYNMKHFSKALSYFERALNILQDTLPPTHPNIKTVKESIEIVKRNYK